jgi:hypothetical protein
MNTLQKRSLGEALRTVGPALDAEQVRTVHIDVNVAGLAVRPEGTAKPHWYDWDAVAALTAEQQAQRQTASALDSAEREEAFELTRWSVLLRCIGELLDAQGRRVCSIEAAVAPADDPSACRVRVTANEELIVGEEQIALQFLRIRLRLREAAAPTSPTPQPWWRRIFRAA